MKKKLYLFLFLLSACSSDSEFYLQEAQKNYQELNYAEAIYYYSQLIAQEPENANAYLMRGLSKLKTGDKSGACADWGQAGQLGSAEAYTLIQENCQP